MKRYGLKTISIQMVMKDYSSIIENTHFHVNDTNIEEIMNDSSLKELSLNDTGMLMALGTEGLHFLSLVIRTTIEGYELSADQEWEIYCECDGFGKLSSEELKEINGGWDWSHIRDSSAEALKNAELKAKEILVDLYNKK